MKLGTISAVDNTNGLTLVIDGESSATTKKYHYLSSYVPTAGDRVLIEEAGDSIYDVDFENLYFIRMVVKIWQ